jgi:hypothetical protein
MSIGKTSSTTDQGVKVAAAFSVLLFGILGAMLFRNHNAPGVPFGAENGDRLVLRGQSDPDGAEGFANRTGDSQGSGASSFAQTMEPRKVLKPLAFSEPPPELARQYPSPSPTSIAEWVPKGIDGISGSGLMTAPSRKHKITDGDTLSTLAMRYLGSPDRWKEIYEANREALASPEIMPIGVELTIPSAANPPPAPPNYMPKRPLAPVAQGNGEKS